MIGSHSGGVPDHDESLRIIFFRLSLQYKKSVNVPGCEGEEYNEAYPSNETSISAEDTRPPQK